MKVSSEQRADTVCRMQVENPDGTWAVFYKDLAAEFGVSRCLISKIAQRAGLARREYCRQVGVTEARRLIEDHMRIRGISYELIAA